MVLALLEQSIHSILLEVINWPIKFNLFASGKTRQVKTSFWAVKVAEFLEEIYKMLHFKNMSFKLIFMKIFKMFDRSKIFNSDLLD
jgi:hypothetical protein